VEPTSKNDARELAQLRAEEDATPLVRKIESMISLWDGKEQFVVQFGKDTNIAVLEYVMGLYKNVGWQVQLTDESYYNGPSLSFY
jgi:hypothetical protein